MASAAQVIHRYRPAHDTAVRELRRQDLLELLLNVPEIARRMHEYLKQPDVAAYLESQHGLDTDKVMHWIQTAVKDIDIGKLTPAAEMKAGLAALKGAPLATGWASFSTAFRNHWSLAPAGPFTRRVWH